ncbi:MAG: hypothetical protein IRZ11_07005 [Clostridia bacterium]|nr:hypothetical protein [Clostridia bacterium]
MGVRVVDWVNEAATTVEALVAKTPQLAERRLAVVLGGSAVTPYADAFSGLDLFVFGFGDMGPRWKDGEKRRGRAAGRRFKYWTRDWEAFERELGEWRDDALHLRLYGRVCYDPHGLLAARWSPAFAVPPEVWLQKAEARMRALRDRQASLAWGIRRGQALTVLDSLLQILTLALEIALDLEGEPTPPRKWLLQAALRTPLGRRLRPLALELLDGPAGLVNLGGTREPLHNRLYDLADRIRQKAAEALLAAGGDLAWASGEGRG